jgi:hypothetical protein
MAYEWNIDRVLMVGYYCDGILLSRDMNQDTSYPKCFVGLFENGGVYTSEHLPKGK